MLKSTVSLPRGAIRAAAALAFLIAAGVPPTPARAQQTLDQVVASVDGDPITMRDVIDFAAANGNPIQPGDLASSPVAKAVLKNLVEQKLLEQEVKKYESKVDEEQVDRYLDEVRKDRHLTDAQFRASLKENGVSYDEMRKRARLELEKTIMIQQQVREKIEIPDADVKAYYDNHREAFTIEKERINLAQILIAVPKGASRQQVAAAGKKAQDVRARVLKGGDFGDLARIYSDDDSKSSGGELGWFEPADVMDQIMAGVKELKPGQVSAVIRTDHGFHIVKLEDHEIPGVRPYAEVKDQIHERLIDQAGQARIESWIESDLVKQHYVETLY